MPPYMKVELVSSLKLNAAIMHLLNADVENAVVFPSFSPASATESEGIRQEIAATRFPRMPL